MPDTYIRMKLVHPEHYDAEGKMVVDPQLLMEWAQVPVKPVAECGHAETMCSECLASWMDDWFIHPEDAEIIEKILRELGGQS